jgi:hypothetical protein
MLEGVVTAHQGTFPVGPADAVAVLQTERLFLGSEAELLGGREMADHVG